MNKYTTQWIIAATAIAIVGAGIFAFENLDNDPTEAGKDPRIQIVSWNWKKDRSGKILAIYGSIRNLTDRDIQSVVLELRTEAGGNPIGHHALRVKNIPAGGDKPFREDIIRTGKEEMGYLTVKTVEERPANSLGVRQQKDSPR